MDAFTWILILALAVVILWVFLMGDTMSTLVLVMVAAILCFVLLFFGFVTVTGGKNSLDILFNTSPAPPLGNSGTLGGSGTLVGSSAAGGSGAAAGAAGAAGATGAAGGLAQGAAPVNPTTGPEVFYVSDNKFTYEEAQYVCKAYDSELATYLQVEQAYNSGAEWCGYGWSAGGIALFPMQQKSWEVRQTDPDIRKREMCGRPGVNGGHFDPMLKFGVNCYGIKPKEPPQQKQEVSDENDRLIGMFKDQVDKLVVDPFTKKVWSEYNIEDTHTPTGGAAPIVVVAPAPAPAPSPIETTLSGLGTAVVGVANAGLSSINGAISSITGSK